MVGSIICFQKFVGSDGLMSTFLQSNEVKKLPFVLVINLQVEAKTLIEASLELFLDLKTDQSCLCLQIPAKPNYSLVFYYGARKPIRPGSLLDKFVTGDDAFRNSRLKLIPRIVEVL